MRSSARFPLGPSVGDPPLSCRLGGVVSEGELAADMIVGMVLVITASRRGGRSMGISMRETSKERQRQVRQLIYIYSHLAAAAAFHWSTYVCRLRGTTVSLVLQADPPCHPPNLFSKQSNHAPTTMSSDQKPDFVPPPPSSDRTIAPSLSRTAY